MGNCRYCKKCVEKENENQIDMHSSHGVRDRENSDIINETKTETNIRNEIQLKSNYKVLPINERIGNQLNNRDLVSFNKFKEIEIPIVENRKRRETNIRNEIQLKSNYKVLPINERIGNQLNNRDLVYFNVNEYQKPYNYNTNINNSSNRIGLKITNGQINFNSEFNNYQQISEIENRIRRETNIRKGIQLIANAEVLPMNKKIGDKLKNGDLVLYQKVFIGGKYFN